MLYQLSYTPKADCELRRPRGEIKRRFAGFVWFCKKPDATHPVMDIDRPSAPEIFAHAPWAHVAKPALAATKGVPTMLGPQEQQFYYWLTSVWARGDGAVVDLGCCAGGSTARLAAGAADSGLNTRIVAYDRFTAAEPLKETLLYANGIETFAGNDILPLAERLLSPWSDRIDLIPGEIEDNAWDGGPIELLVIDSAKTADSLDAQSALFYPHLIAGQSVILHQDFLHWSQPWLAAQMELMSDYFTPLACVPRSTVAFLCTTTPDADALAIGATADLTDADIQALIAAARTRMAPFGRDDRFQAMADGLAANPGERVAWKFRRPDSA